MAGTVGLSYAALGDDLLPITVAIVVIVISSFVLLLYFCCLRGGNKGTSICFVGLSDAGKTLLFLRLTSGFYSRTQTSMKENVKEYLPNPQGKMIDVIDIPGNERLRSRILQKYKPKMRALVWVIDSVNFPKDVRSLAQLGHELFSDPYLQKRRTPVLIACNKQDLSLAQTCDEIKSKLEKEISQVMVSTSAQLASLDSGSDQKAASIPGCSNGEFSFSSLLRNKVEFTSCSARGKGDEENCTSDISAIQQWIAQCY